MTKYELNYLYMLRLLLLKDKKQIPKPRKYQLPTFQKHFIDHVFACFSTRSYYKRHLNKTKNDHIWLRNPPVIKQNRINESNFSFASNEPNRQ